MNTTYRCVLKLMSLWWCECGVICNQRQVLFLVAYVQERMVKTRQLLIVFSELELNNRNFISELQIFDFKSFRISTTSRLAQFKSSKMPLEILNPWPFFPLSNPDFWWVVSFYKSHPAARASRYRTRIKSGQIIPDKPLAGPVITKCPLLLCAHQ